MTNTRPTKTLSVKDLTARRRVLLQTQGCLYVGICAGPGGTCVPSGRQLLLAVQARQQELFNHI